MPPTDTRPAPQCPAPASEGLATLARAHLALAKALDQLEKDTSAAQAPAVHIIAKARYELAMAARDRRATVLGLAATIARHVGPGSSDALRQVRTVQTELDRYTSEYVGFWTTHRVAADWPSYRAAAAEKRRLVRDSIRLEKELLEPLLRVLSDPKALVPTARTPLRACA